MPRRAEGAVLPPSFYNRATLVVARELLGTTLVHATPEGVAAGTVVEAEAYIGEDDPACHAAPGPTQRNRLLYGPPGVAYVYLNYGIHYLVNAVTETEGKPAAVLIRALAPVRGVELMRARRASAGQSVTGRTLRVGATDVPDADLCRGPGNLTRALGITLAQNGTTLSSSTLWIERGRRPAGRVAWGPRVGIRVGTERPWRCWIDGHPSVSGARRP
jgi:DNA-3-methyladenine glycosylase